MKGVRWWQWPNVVSLDASAVAAVWYAAFAESYGHTPSTAAGIVLALSVWLVYTADRLFDVSRRNEGSLLSIRHRWAKQHSRKLWQVWAAVLVADLGIALSHLDGGQLGRGILVLILCLAYAYLNQALSERFFPKELVVAFIFALGVAVFAAPPVPWFGLLPFAVLCLANCLLIAAREREVDHALRLRTLSGYPVARILRPAAAAGVLLLLFAPWPLAITIAASALLLVGVHRMTGQRHSEDYRIFMDVALIPAPLIVALLA